MTHIRLVRFGVLLLCLLSFFAYALPKTAYAATDTVVAVSTSAAASTCAIMTDGSLKCWGNNSSGQLGYDDTVNRGGNAGDMPALAAVNLGTGRTVKMVSTGSEVTCAVLDNGTLKCWGRNTFGQLGYDDTTDRGGNAGDMAALGTVFLGAGRTAKAVSVADNFACAILDNGKLKCWGSNSYGQLGYDDTTYRGGNPGDMAALGYVDLGAGRTAVSVSTGGEVTCAVLDNGKIKCWGYNAHGQLGTDDSINRGGNPGDMAALNTINLGAGRTARAVATDGLSTCAILDTKQLKCWGYNGSGKLGSDDTTDRGGNSGDMAALAPVNLGAGRTAVALSIFEHTCVVLDNKSLKCWGGNDGGGLGQDDTVGRGGNPGDMAALDAVNLGAGRTAKTVDAGLDTTCAILDNDRLKCWGYNDYGQLGQNDTVDRGGFAGSMAALQPVTFTSGGGGDGGDGGDNKKRCRLQVPENTSMCDLRYSDLSSVDYSSVGWDFSGIDFRYADMSMSNFSNINFSTSNLAHVNFAYSVLDGVDFSNTNLNRAYLQNTSMRGVISGGIVGADIVLPADWRLVQGFLIGPFANLRHKAITNSNLAGAQLMYAQLAYTNLASSQLQGADLSGSDARGADMSYTNLTGATLRWSTLMWSNFSFANLTGANLSGAFLAGANFHGANLSGADLTGADLTGVNWQDTICPDGTNSNTHNQTCVY